MYKISHAIMLISVFLASNATTVRAESATKRYEYQLLQEEQSFIEKEQQKKESKMK